MVSLRVVQRGGLRTPVDYWNLLILFYTSTRVGALCPWGRIGWVTVERTDGNSSVLFSHEKGRVRKGIFLMESGDILISVSTASTFLLNLRDSGAIITRGGCGVLGEGGEGWTSGRRRRGRSIGRVRKGRLYR